MQVAINGAEIAYDDIGSGPAILLIHAGIADRTMWSHQIEAFRADFRLVAPDLRGFGDSTIPDMPFSLTADMVALLDHLNIERATVVGVSMGGEVALDLALEFPDRVERLVLVSTRAAMETASDELQDVWLRSGKAFESGDLELAIDIEVDAWIVGARRDPGDLDPGFLDQARAMIRRTWERAAADGEVGELLEPAVHRRHRLAEVAAPVLVVIGDHDLDEVIESCAMLATGIPGATRVVMPDTMHLPPLERPVEFNRILEEFLGKDRLASWLP